MSHRCECHRSESLPYSVLSSFNLPPLFCQPPPPLDNATCGLRSIKLESIKPLATLNVDAPCLCQRQRNTISPNLMVYSYVLTRPLKETEMC